MNLPTLPLCAAARLVAACFAASAPAARAVEIQVEVLFDSLAQPPAPLSNCFTNSGDGGGIFADNFTLNITNSTVSGNMNVLIGAGIAVQGGTTNITNSTITANHATGSVIPTPPPSPSTSATRRRPPSPVACRRRCSGRPTPTSSTSGSP